jgi:hypothetical protein
MMEYDGGALDDDPEFSLGSQSFCRDLIVAVAAPGHHTCPGTPLPTSAGFQSFLD